MSKATKRKHVRQEICDSEWQPPGHGQALARVLAGRGNNLHEVMVAGDIPFTHARPSSPQIISTKRGADSVTAKNSSDQNSAVLANATQGNGKTPSDNNKHLSANNGVGVVLADGDAKRKNTTTQLEYWAEKRILASMPRKFRRSVWVRRGDVVIVEWIPEGEKVKAEIVSVILRKMVRSLRVSGELKWPPEFDHPDFGDLEKSPDESGSGEEGEDFLPANTNRRPPLEIETSSSSSTSSTGSSSSSDDDDSESEDEEGGAAGSVFENPNRRTVSRSISKSESSQSDIDNVIEGNVI